MYNVTRQEASESLQISVRSVDRYIKSGKLRIKKEGKNILIHSSDVDTIQHGGKSKQHVIIDTQKVKSTPDAPKRSPESTYTSSEISTGQEESALRYVYADLKKEIVKKDDLIQTLAIRVGKAEEIAKNSISINDFKKSQFLLEESKSVIFSELSDVKKEKETLQTKLRYEKERSFLLLAVAVLLFMALFFIWIKNV